MTTQNSPTQFSVPLDRTANAPISEGVHLFTVKSYEEGTSSTGNPMWTFDLACQTPAEAGKSVRLYLPLTDSMRWKLEIFLDAVQAPKTGQVTADKFVGKPLRAQIIHEDYQGRPQAKIGEMYPPTAPAAKSVAKPTANPALKSTAAAPKAKPAAVRAEVPAELGDAVPSDPDKIPF